MNAGIFRLVFSKRQGKLVPVAEITVSHSKAASGEGSTGVHRSGPSIEFPTGLRILPALIALILAPAALANPTLPSVVSGQASFNSVGNTLTITNSANAIVNWQGFSIGANETTRFVQPSVQSSVLNRVTGSDPSNILGSLQSNGKVFLINPHGILFGKDSRVDVGGLVASTLNLSNEDFLNSQFSFSDPGNAGRLVNQGQIRSTAGGQVWLIGHDVENSGLIESPEGQVILAAGQSIDLAPNGAEDLSVSFTADAHQAVNLGDILADGGQVNVFGALIDQQGVIQANTLEIGKNGRILLKASSSHGPSAIDLAEGSLTRANATQADADGGEILALADMQHGQVTLAGRLEAKAQAGDGGFVETSAAKVRVSDTARVDTRSEIGQTGEWLIDPTDYTVAASGGDISGDTLSANLGSSSVTLESSSGATHATGSININDPITWSADTTLTLTASHDVNVNADITANGANAGLALNPNTDNGGQTASGSGAFNLAMGTAINLPNVSPSSSSALVIAGTPYTVINSLGAEDSNTGTDLQGMSGNLSGKYALGSDIDASATSGWNSGAGFAPVGTDYNTSFTGTLDGLGHAISGLSINRPTTDYVGLVGWASSGSVLRNVGVTGGAVSGSYYVGGLVGENYGSLSNSYSSGTVSGADNVGGLVGLNNGSLSNSYSSGTVSGTSYVGGLVGSNYGSLSNSHYDIDSVILTVNGAAQATGLTALTTGGLRNAQYTAWLANGRSLSPATYFGTPDAQGYYTLSTLQHLQDLLGFADDSGLKFRLAADLDLTSLAGWHLPVYAAADLDGGGHTLSNLVVNQPYNSEKGFIGHLKSGSSVHDLGLSNVAVSGSSYVGGLVGLNYDGSLSNSYSSGTVSGNYYVGGLVGNNYGSLSNSYSSGAVSGADNVGGLVGSNYGSLSNSYSSGAVSGTSSVGGLVGMSFGTVTASYWDTETSGQATSAGGTGLTTAQMKQQASFSGWDFADVWAIEEGVGYPTLRSVAIVTPTGLYWDGDAGDFLWSSAPNWSTDTLPGLSDDVVVNVPGHTISYTSGDYSISRLDFTGNFNFTGGSLSVENSASFVGGFTQSGTASLMAQTLSINSSSGVVQADTASINAVNLLLQGSGTFGIEGNNQIGTFSAYNSGSGNLHLVNNGTLQLLEVLNHGGNIQIENTGELQTSGTVEALSGSVTLLTHSPLHIGMGGVSAHADISLTAGASAATGDDLTLDGPVSSFGAGNITLFAGDNLNQNANISSEGGAIQFTALTGDINIASTATTQTSGHIGFRVAGKVNGPVPEGATVQIGGEVDSNIDAVLNTAINQTESTNEQLVGELAPADVTQSAATESSSEITVEATASRIETGAADPQVNEKARSEEGLTVDTNLTRQAMGEVLKLRHDFKTELFSDAVKVLQDNRTVAELKECRGEVKADCMRVSGGNAKARNLPKPKLAYLPQIERKVALLIGINDYQNRIPKLKGAIPDVQAVASLLKDRMGYEVRVVTDARKADIVENLNSLVEEIDDNDSVAIYYAGHGYQMDKTRVGYWIPADGSPSNPENWLSNDDINKYLSNIQAKQVMLVSDSCYSGTFATEAKVTVNGQLQPESVLKNRSVLVMSSGGEEPVADQGKGGHSIFAWNFMQAMQQVSGWKEGAQLYQYVRDEVTRSFPQTPQYGASPNAGHVLGGDYLFEERQY